MIDNSIISEFDKKANANFHIVKEDKKRRC